MQQHINTSMSNPEAGDFSFCVPLNTTIICYPEVFSFCSEVKHLLYSLHLTLHN